MLGNVFTKALWDQRRGYVGWVIGVAAMAIVNAVFYPWMDTPEMAEAMAAIPEDLLLAFGWQDLISPEGYLAGQVFDLLGPMLLIIYAIAAGSAAIAGDEEAGTLEQLIAHPVARASVLLQRAAALAVGLAGLGAAVWIALLAVNDLSGLHIPPGLLAAACLQMVLLALCFGALALAVGAASGRRGLVVGLSASLAVASYLASTLVTLVDEIAWMERFSLFFYATGGEPLRHGVQLGDAAILLAVTAVLVAMAVAAFDRRDVAV